MSTVPRPKVKSPVPELTVSIPFDHSELKAPVDEPKDTPIVWVICAGILGYILLRLGLHAFYYIALHWL